MKNILDLSKYFLPGGNVQKNEHSFNNGINSGYTYNNTRSAIKLIAYFFSPINALASKPVFSVTANNIIIHVFYYIPVKEQALNNNTVNNLGKALSSIFKRPVELRLVKLHFPYLNSYILAQHIALNMQDYTFIQIVRRIFGSLSPVKNVESLNNTSIKLPSTLLTGSVVGVKVRVSGRLMTERSRPRETVQTAQIGSFAKSNLSLVDTASFTTKNKKGAFTVKVWVSQRAIV